MRMIGKQYAGTLTAIALLLSSSALLAQPKADLASLKSQLPGQLMNDPTRADWPIHGTGATSRPRKAADAPGGGALEVTIPSKGPTPYASGLSIPLTGAVQRGQDVVISFYARTVSADTADGNGIVGVRFQEGVAPYDGFGDRQVTIGHEWKLYEVAARADRDLPASHAEVALQLSAAGQTLQISQAIVQTGATSLVRHQETSACKTQTPAMMPQLAGQGQLLTDIDALNWNVSGPVEKERFSACGIAGDSAWRFTIASPGQTAYDAVATVPLSGALHEGEPLLIAFIARTVKAATPAGTGRLGVRVQVNAPPYTGFADHMFDIGPTWKLIQLRTAAKADIADGQGAVALQMSEVAQTLEIGRVYVLRTSATP
jgi:hypothetical protein